MSLAVLVGAIAAVFRGGGADAPPPVGSAAGMVLILLQSGGVLAAVAAAAWGYGGRWHTGCAARRMTLGVACWLLVTYLVAWAGGMAGGWGFAPAAVVGNLAVGWALWAWQLARKRTVEPAPDGDRGGGWPWTVVLGMPGLAVMLVAACCPPGTMWRVEASAYDVTSYHLQIPREWIAAGGMVELKHSVYAYLPGLVEAGYAALAVLHGLVFAAPAAAGVVEPAVYVCQLFHAGLAVLAAWNIAAQVTRLTGRREAGGFAAALVLLTPWVQVTGSLAYNEMAVLAFAAAGLGLIPKPDATRGRAWWRDAAEIGLLAGAATLAKPTAGYAVALPLGVLLVVRVARAAHLKQALAAGGLCAAVGLLTLSPWLIRNATWTGNPVFPLATGALGTGHWDDQRAQRWDQAHGRRARAQDTSAAEATWRQALGNAGYGAVGGRARPAEQHNVARFGREGGLPVTWLLAAAGGALAWGRSRGAVAGLALFLAWQLAGWLALTHLQSRFLLPVALPLAALAGLGVAAGLGRGARVALGTRVATGGVGLVLAAHGVAVAWDQAPRYRDAAGQLVAIAPGWLVDSRTEPSLGGVSATNALNLLPAGSRVMVVGNNASLLYVRTPMAYASAFDRCPLTPFMNEASGPTTPVSRLRDAGFTHLWVGYSELDRLHATYGFDAAVTRATVGRLTAGWPVVGDPQAATVLYEVPAAVR